MQALPNYFVGLGLVLTFLGLIAGLYFASRGMRTADMIEARAALVHLLNSATFKFLTSVAGISMSLIVSLTFRIGQFLRLRLDLLCDRIEGATARGVRHGASPSLTGSDGGAVLAERLAQLVQSIDRLEAAMVEQTAAETDAVDQTAVPGKLRREPSCPIQPIALSKDEGYYASMADLMAGMLFIFIIIAMVFALDVRKDRVDAVAEAEAKAEARVKAELDVPATPLDRPSPADTEIAVRARLIETIRDFLASLRHPGRKRAARGIVGACWLASNSPRLKGASPLPAGQTMISHLGEALGRWLPCMAAGAPAPDAAACQPFAGARLRTVRIETHAEPGLQTAAEAESLTGARAVHLLSGLLGAGAPLLDLRNDAAERLLDIRGMGVQWPLEPALVEPVPTQPVAEPAKPAPPPAKGAAGKKDAGKNDTVKGIPAKVEPPQPRSQRIDLRFEMVVLVTEQPGQGGGLILRPTAK